MKIPNWMRPLIWALALCTSLYWAWQVYVLDKLLPTVVTEVPNMAIALKFCLVATAPLCFGAGFTTSYVLYPLWEVKT